MDHEGHTMPMTDYWEIGSDNSVSVEQAQDAITGAWMNGLVVTGRVSTGGVNVGDEFDLDYRTGTDGGYYGVVPASVTSAFVENGIYAVTITATLDGTVVKVGRIVRAARYGGPTA
jgi:hypothetical protein